MPGEDDGVAEMAEREGGGLMKVEDGMRNWETGELWW